MSIGTKVLDRVVELAKRVALADAEIETLRRGQDVALTELRALTEKDRGLVARVEDVAKKYDALLASCAEASPKLCRLHVAAEAFATEVADHPKHRKQRVEKMNALWIAMSDAAPHCNLIPF